MSDPGTTITEVEDGAKRLEAAADSLYAATVAAADAEREYERAMEKQLLTIYHAAKRAGERMPAEDVRRAIAHEKMDAEVYATHLKAKAKLAAQTSLFRGIEKAVSARQSVLRAVGGAG